MLNKCLESFPHAHVMLGIGLINLSGRYVVPTGIERIRELEKYESWDHADKSIRVIFASNSRRSHGHREDKRPT